VCVRERERARERERKRLTRPTKAASVAKIAIRHMVVRETGNASCNCTIAVIEREKVHVMLTDNTVYGINRTKNSYTAHGG